MAPPFAAAVVVLEPVHGLRRGSARRFVIFSQPRFERLYTLGEITHNAGYLAAATKKQHGDNNNNRPVPNAERAHYQVTR